MLPSSDLHSQLEIYEFFLLSAVTSRDSFPPRYSRHVSLHAFAFIKKSTTFSVEYFPPQRLSARKAVDYVNVICSGSCYSRDARSRVTVKRKINRPSPLVCVINRMKA